MSQVIEHILDGDPETAKKTAFNMGRSYCQEVLEGGYAFTNVLMVIAREDFPDEFERYIVIPNDSIPAQKREEKEFIDSRIFDLILTLPKHIQAAAGGLVLWDDGSQRLKKIVVRNLEFIMQFNLQSRLFSLQRARQRNPIREMLEILARNTRVVIDMKLDCLNKIIPDPTELSELLRAIQNKPDDADLYDGISKWSDLLRNNAELKTQPTTPTKPKKKRNVSARPMTIRQTSAVQLWGELKGNISAVAKAMGLDPKTVCQHLEAGHKKMGITFNHRQKVKSQNLPHGKRGEVLINNNRRFEKISRSGSSSE